MHAHLTLIAYTISGYVSYVVAEVTNCKQADAEFRGHQEIFSEHGGVMDFEEDRSSRPKR